MYEKIQGKPQTSWVCVFFHVSHHFHIIPSIVSLEQIVHYNHAKWCERANADMLFTLYINYCVKAVWGSDTDCESLLHSQEC